MAGQDVQRVTPTVVEAQGPGLVEYLGIFTRRPKLIFLPMIALFLIAGFVATVIPEKYQAMTRMKVRDVALEADLVGMTQVIPAHKPALQTISIDVMKRSFLLPIIEEIGLTEGYNVRSAVELNELFEYIHQNLKLVLNTAKVGDDVVTISYRGRDPDKVMEFVNSVRKHYIDDFIKDFRDTIHGAYEQTRLRKERLESTLADFQSRREAYRARDDIQAVLAAADRGKQLADWETMRQELRLEIDSLRDQEKSIKYQIEDQTPTVSIDSMVPNPKRNEVKGQLDRALLKLHLLTEVKGLTDKVRDVKETKALVAQLQKQYDSIPKEIPASRVMKPNELRTSLEQEKLKIVRTLKAKQEAMTVLNRDLIELQRQMDRVPEVLGTLEQYADDILTLGRRLTDLTRSFDRLDNTWSNMRGSGSDIFETTDFPRNDLPPVFPSVPLFLGIGAGAGLLLGIGLAFLREFSGMTFTTSSQVQSVLPVAVLGEVGRIATADERKQASRKSIRRWVILAVIVALLTGVHVMYFNKEWSKHLPAVVVRTLDQVYDKGR